MMLTRRQENKKRVFEMLAQGVPQKDIATVLGLTPSAVSRIISRGGEVVEIEGRRSEIAEKILEVLKVKGWTQDQLAEELGVSLRSLQHWLKGDRKPNGAVVRLLNILSSEERLSA